MFLDTRRRRGLVTEGGDKREGGENWREGEIGAQRELQAEWSV